MKTRDQWEYMESVYRETSNYPEIEWLNTQGENGWEVIAREMDGARKIYYFKRKVDKKKD